VRWTDALLVLAAAVLLGGCAGTKEAVFPADLPPMQTIYERHFAEAPRGELAAERTALRSRSEPAAEHARVGTSWSPRRASVIERAASPVHARFQRLPNPDLVMFVFPHLAGDDAVPVPGYATVFPLYERPRYALPGEVPGW
jgi:conjugative transfer region lipoprotein (TIGR03751 family)